MTTDGDLLARAVSTTQVVLLDFDGPICSIFAGRPAASIAEDLCRFADEAGARFTESASAIGDPLEVLRIVARVAPSLVRQVEEMLSLAEFDAAQTARPTPTLGQVIDACHESGRRLGVVSNNSTPAVMRYLDSHDLTKYFAVVVGRDDADPALMKPSPYLVQRAVSQTLASPGQCVLVGDSVSDILAARAAGVASIGYANKPTKDVRLADAGADAIVTDLGDLAVALRK